MPGISDGVVHAFELPGVLHDVECKVECSTPCIFDFRMVQLGINIDEATAKNLRATLDGIAGLGKEGSAAAKEHAILRGEPVVIKIVFGIVDHPIPGAEFTSEIVR